MNSNELINEAEKYLHVSHCGNRRYYYAEETSTYYWVNRKELIDLAKRLRRRDKDAYSFWCAESSDREVGKRTLKELGLKR
jgi:hypothetical protein